MEERSPQGYYLIAKETKETILFRPSEGRRRRSAVLFTIAGLMFLAYGVYIVQTRPPLSQALEAAQGSADVLTAVLTFLAFPLVGLGFLIAALFAWWWWTEIEFNLPRQCIVRRRHAFGRVEETGVLPFSHLAGIQVMKSGGLYAPAYYHLLIIGEGKVWAKLPGYTQGQQAEALGRRLLRFMGLSQK